ncbi:carotenoid 1,2-hydratase [Shewanella schlegeliana]|uniref:Carotenoid 1,2-hydratase n=1 Tax=Shewanella schlegeliana TaxID=190308 RepID=A0ABS1SXC5_9GAMM|nr:lipocalin-like domain-containing protein [Shewanella schlegeliana]MBL4912544.1 carotenoid 1,2-hydratase [Shewanella schlegeliana]MCL1107986.1 carotenoid 1,2-hydratase [Shewanella schlegeliana]GIU21298.1 carotenoid 1,2-hydratase [Shewanella schlegeliana]
MRPLIWGLVLTLSLGGCFFDDSSSDTKQGMGQLLDGNTQGYAAVVPGKQLSFPADHQAHDDFRQEWWYLTANLETETGEQLGLQWTQFRIALAPPTTATEQKSALELELELDPDNAQESAWKTEQLYMSHTAVTTKNQHLATEKWSRGHPHFAGTQISPLTIKQDSWQWRSDDNQLFPATLFVTSNSFSYQLKLDSQAPFQLQGDNGYSQKNASGTVASYYYSQPFIKVNGTIELDGKSIRVSGEGWLDREWSSQFLAKTQQGWDWFALRLDDGSTLMLFQLRQNQSNKQHFYSGRRMYRDGRGYNIASKEISMTPTAWQQTPSGRYPVSWQIAIPSENIQLTTQALNVDSSMPLSIPYWEGPIKINGSHNGLGYMELTGY